MSRFTYAPPSGAWPPDRSTKPEFRSSASGQTRPEARQEKSRVAGDHAPEAQPSMRPRGMGEQSVDRTSHYAKKAKLAVREESAQKNASPYNALLKVRAAKALAKLESKNDRIERENTRDR